MTTELDALPESVREAVRTMDNKNTVNGCWSTCRDELIRLAEENARLRPMLTARSQEMLRLVSESGELKTRAEEAEARVQELERENAILEIKNRGTLANNLCPDHRDKQTGKPCLACTIETLTRKKDRAEAELAAIKKRIAEAPKTSAYADGDDGLTIGCGPHILACMDESEIGECFAIVKLEDGE